MRVLVCGGRDFTDRELLFDTLDKVAKQIPIKYIITGCASGADRLAAAWAQARRVELQLFIAEWTKQGRSAGPRRNQRMLVEGKPDMVIAFPGGDGTADMVRRAKAAKVNTFEININTITA